MKEPPRMTLVWAGAVWVGNVNSTGCLESCWERFFQRGGESREPWGDFSACGGCLRAAVPSQKPHPGPLRAETAIKDPLLLHPCKGRARDPAQTPLARLENSSSTPWLGLGAGPGLEPLQLCRGVKGAGAKGWRCLDQGHHPSGFYPGAVEGGPGTDPFTSGVFLGKGHKPSTSKLKEGGLASLHWGFPAWSTVHWQCWYLFLSSFLLFSQRGD